jgi:hypothetical protein
VYGDGYGGIPEVRWRMDTWDDRPAPELTEGCFGGQGSCIRVDLKQWSGFHLYYWQAFALSTFNRLSLRLRALSGAGGVTVAPSREGTRCQEARIAAGQDWSQVTIDLASACSGVDAINAVTVQVDSEMSLLFDDVRFE